MTSDDVVAAIRALYFGATKATIGRDFDRAIDLLKSLPDDETRERAAVFMDGLAEMRGQWGAAKAPPPGTTRSPSPGASGPRGGAARARSDRSTPRARRGR